jgi:hypothetical protein
MKDFYSPKQPKLHTKKSGSNFKHYKGQKKLKLKSPTNKPNRDKPL